MTGEGKPKVRGKRKNRGLNLPSLKPSPGRRGGQIERGKKEDTSGKASEGKGSGKNERRNSMTKKKQTC